MSGAANWLRSGAVLPGNPPENHLVLGRPLREPLAAAMRGSLRIRDPFALRGRRRIAQNQAILRVAPVDHILHRRPGGVEKGVIRVAVDAGVPIGALLS